MTCTSRAIAPYYLLTLLVACGDDAGPAEAAVITADAAATGSEPSTPTGSLDGGLMSSLDATLPPAMSDAQAPAQDASSTFDAAVLACAQPDLCPAPYPCIDHAGGGYRCEGQLAHWPIPDVQAGAKATLSYDYSSGTVVHDLVTGLAWQRVLPEVYAGCTGMSKTPGDSCTVEEAKRYCAELPLEGQRWRLPSKVELESIVGPTASIPAIDTRAFLGNSGRWFWTASPIVTAVEPDLVRFTDSYANLHFGFGISNFADGGKAYGVRCVRTVVERTGTPATRFSMLDAAAVLDNHTGLTWQVDAFEAPDPSYDAAAHCKARGDAWRLPSMKELLSLHDPVSPVGVDARAGVLEERAFLFSSNDPNPLDQQGPMFVNLFGGMTTVAAQLAELSGQNPGTNFDFLYKVKCVR